MISGSAAFSVKAPPRPGLDAEHLVLAAVAMLGLGGAVLAEGRRRERRFDIALWRLGDR